MQRHEYNQPDNLETNPCIYTNTMYVTENSKSIRKESSTQLTLYDPMDCSLPFNIFGCVGSYLQHTKSSIFSCSMWDLVP